MSLHKLYLNKEFIKFMGVGGFAAAVNFGSRIILSNFFPYVYAIIIAFVFGVITAYSLCRMWVFDPQENSQIQQIGYFTFINVIALLQTVIVSLVLVKYILVGITDLSLREAIAHFVGVCLPVFTSYLGHKYITFK
jgi:putative flippase GtrA